MQELSGKVAVVTGAASGIGAALAERFAREGMGLVVADVDGDGLDATAQRLRREGADVLARPTDVTDLAAVERLGQAATSHFGTFHVVCNNAGVAGHAGRSWEQQLEDWRWVLEVNLFGVIHGVRALVPTLVRQNEGHVVNTGSVASWQGIPGMAAYTASKHAVLALTESLRLELQSSRSRVGASVLCPHFINTRIMESERNWLPQLGDEPQVGSDALARAVHQMMSGGVAGGLAPSAVAGAVVEGIRLNRFLITTHPHEVAQAARRRQAIAEGEFPALGEG